MRIHINVNYRKVLHKLKCEILKSTKNCTKNAYPVEEISFGGKTVIIYFILNGQVSDMLKSGIKVNLPPPINKRKITIHAD